MLQLAAVDQDQAFPCESKAVLGVSSGTLWSDKRLLYFGSHVRPYTAVQVHFCLYDFGWPISFRKSAIVLSHSAG